MDVLLQTVPRHNAPPPHYWVTLREEFRKGLHPQFRRGRATCNNTRSILNHNQPGRVHRACLPMFTQVYSCSAMFTCAYLCLPLFPCVYLYLPLFCHLCLQYLTMFTLFYLCLNLFTCVYLFSGLGRYLYLSTISTAS